MLLMKESVGFLGIACFKKIEELPKIKEKKHELFLNQIQDHFKPQKVALIRKILSGKMNADS